MNCEINISWFSAKNPIGEISDGENSFRRIFRSAKVLFGEISVRRKSRSAKIPSAKIPSAKIPSAKIPSVNVHHRSCQIFHQTISAFRTLQYLKPINPQWGAASVNSRADLQARRNTGKCLQLGRFTGQEKHRQVFTVRQIYRPV